MPTTTAISANPVRNDGGTVLYGNIPSGATNITNAQGKTEQGYNSGLYGSQIPSPETDSTIAAGTDTKNVYKPYSAGGYAYQGDHEFTLLGYSRTLAGQAFTGFVGPRSYRRHSIHKIESIKSVLSVTAGWNYATGQYLTAPTVQTDSFGADHAARPTPAIPGELVYLETGLNPTLDDYQPRTTW